MKDMIFGARQGRRPVTQEQWYRNAEDWRDLASHDRQPRRGPPPTLVKGEKMLHDYQPRMMIFVHPFGDTASGSGSVGHPDPAYVDGKCPECGARINFRLCTTANRGRVHQC